MGNWRDGTSTGRTQAALEPEPDLAELLSNAFGYHTETFSRMCRSNSFQMVSGRQYYTAFAIKKGKTINAIDFGCHQAGSVLTLVKFGIISLDFLTVHAVSANEVSQYASPGIKINNMLVPYTSPIDQVLYASNICLGTTGPNGTCMAGSGRGDNGKRGGAAAAPAGSRTSQTDLVAGASGITFDGNSITYWMGFS
jgi:hypothetical protein